MIPHLITYKCIAHRASLGAKDLAKEFREIDDTNYYMYKVLSVFNSKKKLEILDLNYSKIVEANEDESILQLIKPLNIRWISFYPSITRMI